MNRKQFLLTLLVAIISAFLGGALSVWFLMPPSVLAQDGPQKVIEAQEFRVVDEEGNMRAQLRVSGTNMVSLIMHDVNKVPRVTLAIREGNAILVLNDKEAEVARLYDAGPSVQLWDADGNIRAVLGIAELKDPESGSTEIRAPSSLVLIDEDGEVVWSAP